LRIFFRHRKKRPFIALKLATSADGKIAFPLPNPPLQAGEGIKWITGEAARAYGQMLRSRYDAIVTGIGTALADDPLLTCRLPGLEDRSPVRVLFDRKNRLPKHSQLAKTAKRVPLWMMSSPLPEAMATLAAKGITRLMVEAGQKLSEVFLREQLVDRIYWFQSPMSIGNKGLAAALPDLAQFMLQESRPLGEDVLEVYSARK
jgi:diaminohydroxyphosphoribosylaminopyrimidine deaminase/5-amino-6-(5-phosphoribosylamino)uracil reductase